MQPNSFAEQVRRNPLDAYSTGKLDGSRSPHYRNDDYRLSMSSKLCLPIGHWMRDFARGWLEGANETICKEDARKAV